METPVDTFLPLFVGPGRFSSSEVWPVYLKSYDSPFIMGRRFNASVRYQMSLQNYLMAYSHFCENKRMIVNELKTKIITFGRNHDLKLFFNNQKIKTTSQYKYLGNIISGTSTLRSDTFRENYNYQCCQARNAVFGMKHRLKSLGTIPPKYFSICLMH